VSVPLLFIYRELLGVDSNPPFETNLTMAAGLIAAIPTLVRYQPSPQILLNLCPDFCMYQAN
jgi:hypothetical protein